MGHSLGGHIHIIYVKFTEDPEADSMSAFSSMPFAITHLLDINFKRPPNYSKPHSLCMKLPYINYKIQDHEYSSLIVAYSKP